MTTDDLSNLAPKALRPALWVLSFAIATGGLALAGMSAIETKAALAAQSAVSPLGDRVARLEAGQVQLWSTLNIKLDAISNQLVQTRQDVAVLSQRIEDQHRK